MLLLRIISLLAFFSCFSLYAQIPDITKLGDLGRTSGGSTGNGPLISDAVQSIYGPKTTKWTSEENFFTNRPSYQTLDTSLYRYDCWTYVQRSNNFYQDLGVMGTALRPIFVQVPTTIGATSGFNSYEPYYTSEEIHYHDTKSPYSRFKIIWGGKGRATTSISFSRNINPRWNFGFNYRPIIVVKQIQSKGKNDLQTNSQYYDGYTTFKSKNEKYFLLFNFRRIRHKVNENGGIVVKDKLVLDPSLFDINASPVLTSSQSEWYYRNIHLFHQYEVVKGINVYHKADFTKQTNEYSDDMKVAPQNYYPYREKVDTLKNDKISDKTLFQSMQQEIGAKSDIGKFFLSVYYKYRDFNYTNNYLNGINLAIPTNAVENYVGGSVIWHLDSISKISLEAEQLHSGHYKIDAKVDTRWVEGYFHNSLAKPGFLPSLYRGKTSYWNEKINGTNTMQVKGYAKLKVGSQQFWIGGTVTRTSNLIYFRDSTSKSKDIQPVKPYQSSATQLVYSPEVKLSLRFFRHFYFRPQFIYTIANDEDLIRIPKYFANAQLSYENELFKKRIQINVGVEANWRSEYSPLGYSPVVQQFYIQDGFKSPSYSLVDIFLNGKIRRSRFFFKYHNLLQAFTKIGYLPTPIYPGQRNVLDFGFEFILFD